jgi:hypothetical protein
MGDGCRDPAALVPFARTPFSRWLAMILWFVELVISLRESESNHGRTDRHRRAPFGISSPLAMYGNSFSFFASPNL